MYDYSRSSLQLPNAMISIRTYLRAEKQTHDMLCRLVHLLIGGIEGHALEGAPEKAAWLHEKLQQVLIALGTQAEPDELFGRAERAIEALGDNNRSAADNLQGSIAELQAKVGMLTDAITAVSRANPENIRRLKQMKDELVSTVDVREIRSLRARLAQCLDGVMAEAERQAIEVERTADLLNRRIRWAEPASDEESEPTDAATGLPARARAEEAIAQSCQESAAAFVVVMVINQAETLSLSVGRQFGDLVLQRFADMVRQQLPAVDGLFRWTGPSLVALIRRRSAADVRVAIEPVLRQRVTVRNANPDLLVPISCRWTVLPLMASPRLLFHKMDGFAGVALPETTQSA